MPESGHFSTLLVYSLVLLSPMLGGNSSFEMWTHSPEKRSFRNYKLLRIHPITQQALEYLFDLFHTNMSPYELDFWQPPTRIGFLVDVTVAPEDYVHFVKELDAREIDFVVIIDDLENEIMHERMASMRDELPYEHGDDEEFHYRYDRYNPLSLIETQLRNLETDNPKLVSLIEIGKSHENRSIYTVKITSNKKTNNNASQQGKVPAIWLDAGIHAREWIAPATAMHIIQTLISGYRTADTSIRFLLENLEWYITVVLNPDGYEYSHTKNRMWRKNRRPETCKKIYQNRVCCSGVDLNRNFDWHWGSSGSSKDPCHETYHGPSAFSEPESEAVRKFLENIQVKMFITLHSYSQLWLIPFGHQKRTYPSDYYDILRPISLKATTALSQVYGSKYAVGTGADLLYEASGASHDWAKGKLSVPYPFLVELRPQNTLFNSGFLLPESEIVETGEETWAAIKVVAEEVLDKYGERETKTTAKTTSKNTIKTPAATTMTTPSITSTHKPVSLMRTFLPIGRRITPTYRPMGRPSRFTFPPPSSVTRSFPHFRSKTTTPSTSPYTEISEVTVYTFAPFTVAPTTIPAPEVETALIIPQKVVRCRDFGSYCRWWKIHSLCDRPRVLQLCTLSCLPECQI